MDTQLQAGGVVLNSQSFAERLKARSLDRKLLKKERTKYLLLTAATNLLSREPSAKISIEKVLEETGLSRGTFYNHYKDVDGLLVNLLETFLNMTWGSRESIRKKTGEVEAYQLLYETNLAFCYAYREHSHIYALFNEISSTNKGLIRIREQMNNDWVARNVKHIEKRRQNPFDTVERCQIEGKFRMLIAMTIETLRERFVHGDAFLVERYEELEDLATALSEIWWKIISDYYTI
ncbi:TetR/AcrR family transcriptional regulator [Brucella pseudogrignonensis]|uniref:TetR/AcrR family transcriptional regulator n=1 Tax=Brucella pseudogrignonensis TaxID=419475 RepID=UPI00178C4489|nr:TetR/AcrR family transcriptional regulator [Brucella pseudogrignonensis]